MSYGGDVKKNKVANSCLCEVGRMAWDVNKAWGTISVPRLTAE